MMKALILAICLVCANCAVDHIDHITDFERMERKKKHSNYNSNIALPWGQDKDAMHFHDWRGRLQVPRNSNPTKSDEQVALTLLNENVWMQMVDGKDAKEGPHAYDNANEPGRREGSGTLEWMANAMQGLHFITKTLDGDTNGDREITVDMVNKLHLTATAYTDFRAKFRGSSVTDSRNPKNHWNDNSDDDDNNNLDLERQRQQKHLSTLSDSELGVEHLQSWADADPSTLSEIDIRHFPTRAKYVKKDALQIEADADPDIIRQYSGSLMRLQVSTETVMYKLKLYFQDYNDEKRWIDAQEAVEERERQISYRELCSRRLRNVIDLAYNIAQLHPFCDGNGRTRTFVLQRELARNGFHPVSMFNNNRDATVETRAIYTQKVMEGMDIWEKAFELKYDESQLSENPWASIPFYELRHRKAFPDNLAIFKYVEDGKPVSITKHGQKALINDPREEYV